MVRCELIPCPSQQARQHRHLVTAARPFVDQGCQGLSFDSRVCAIAVRVNQIGEYAVQGVHGYLRCKKRFGSSGERGLR
jgi:hypothetical protein